MKVLVKDIDCLIAYKQLQDAGNNPVVLNLADILVPGGCVESGSGAQEESIFRRSNITRTLTQDFYPRKITRKTSAIWWLQKGGNCNCLNGSKHFIPDYINSKCACSTMR